MASTQVVSWSEISTRRQCPKKHQFAYIDRWTEPPEKQGPGLARGTFGHLVLEQHYLGLQAVQQNGGEIEAAKPYALRINDLLGVRDPHQSEEQQLMAWIYAGYLERYPVREEAANWTIKAVEHAAEVWLPTPRGGRSRFKLKMKMDVVVQVGRRLWVVDNKFLKDLPNDRQFEFDDQFGLYTWGMRQLGYKVHGAIYSASRTFRHQDEEVKPHPLDERFKRVLMYRTERELDTIALEAYETAADAWGAGARHGRHPDAGPFGCRSCSYLESCLAGRKGQDEVAVLVAHQFKQSFERH